MASSPSSPSGPGLVAAMFGRIAPGYDAANRILSLGVDRLWRRQLIRRTAKAFQPGTSMRVLDLAAGTLDVSLDLARAIPGVSVLALDFCPPMLKVGQAKLRRGGMYEKQHISLLAGNGLCLPLADCCVDAVTVSFGLRNMLPREQAIAETFRVLRPGGAFHILEFGSGKSRIFGGLYNLYLGHILPYLGGIIAKDREAYRYLARTITEFPPAEQLGKELEEAGFSGVCWQKLWDGIAYIHSGYRPADAAQ